MYRSNFTKPISITSFIIFVATWLLNSAFTPVKNIHYDSSQIEFATGSLEEVLSQAQSSKKYVFVHTTSNSCTPCQGFAESYYQQQSVAEFYNDNFLNFKLDLDKFQYSNFARMHELGKDPALLYFDPNGYMIQKVVNISSANDLINAGRSLLKQRTKDNFHNLEAMKNKYDHSYNDTEFLLEFAYLLKTFGEPYNAVVNQYLNTQKADDILNRTNRTFIYDFSDNLENNAIDFFLLDVHHYKEVVGGSQINNKIKISISNSIYTAIKETDTQLFDKSLKVIESANLPNAEHFKYYISSEFYEGTKDWENYAKINLQYFKDYNITDPVLLTDVALNFSLYVKSKSQLNQAIKWADKSIEIDSNYKNNLSLAYLYRRLGKCQEALKAAEDASRIGTYRKEDISDAERLIDKIKSGRCGTPNP